MNTILGYPTNDLSAPLPFGWTGWGNIYGFRFMFILFSLVGTSLFSNLFLTTKADAASNQVQLLEIPTSSGNSPQTLTFPIYEQEGIQYFSAGLGKEERTLKYPSFPLKLIFVEGDRAYLASVSVQLTSKDGTIRISIPGEEVEGPWLFVKAPIGTYVINVSHSNGTTIEKTINLTTDQTTVTHFRFP